MHRWDNRFVLERESFIETYVKGRASILIVVCRRRCPSTRHPEAVREGVVFNQNETIGSSGRDIIIVCRHINVDSAGARIGEQEPVFVCTVEMVKFDEQIPSTIRLYLADDKVSNVGGESLYYLETGLGYQRIQITPD